MKNSKGNEQNNSGNPQRAKKRLSRKRKVQLCSALLLLIAMWFGWRQLNAPVSGHPVITKDSPKPKALKPKANTSATSLDNAYFQLSLSNGYRPQSASLAVPGLLYQQTIIKPSVYGSTIINIAIKDVPEGGLAGDPSYQLRVRSPARYAITQQIINGESVVVASDAQSAAMVAFWVHGGYLATISVSSGLANPSSDGNSEQLKVLQPLLAAWGWK